MHRTSQPTKKVISIRKDAIGYNFEVFDLPILQECMLYLDPVLGEQGFG